jgi:hypothetical protein
MGRGNGQPDKLQLDDIERFSIDTDFTADADALRVKAQAAFLKEWTAIIDSPKFSVWAEADEWGEDKPMPLFVDKNGLIAQAIKTGEPEEEFADFLLAIGTYLFQSEGEKANDFIRSHRSAFGLYEATTPWMVVKNINARHHFVDSLGSKEMLCGAVLDFPERHAYRGVAATNLCVPCSDELKKLPAFDPRHALLEETLWQVSGETIQMHDTLDGVLRQATLAQLQAKLAQNKPFEDLGSALVIRAAQDAFTQICFEEHVEKSDRERFADLFETTPHDYGYAPDESRPLLAYLTKRVREYYGETPEMPEPDVLWEALEEDKAVWGTPLSRGFLIGAHIISFFPEVEEDLKAYNVYSPFNNQIRKMCGFAEIPDPVPF